MYSPFARPRPKGVPSAVVSGLGPNGVLAALELLAAGYHVTAVEKRPAYIRPIHLHLRASYLNEVRRLSRRLHARLTTLGTPIERMERSRLIGRAFSGVRDNWPATPEWSSREDRSIRNRLVAPPVLHVRLDAAERLFYSYLNAITGAQYALDPTPMLAVRRGFALDLAPDSSGGFRASIRSSDPGDEKAPEVEELGIPDLVVLTEGGKSTNVRRLGLETVRFSYPKYFMSAHTDLTLGPFTRRIDTDVRHLSKDPAIEPADVSLWACGHGDARQGTWIVLEVPEGVGDLPSAKALDYFVEGATILFGVDGTPADELRRKLRRGLDSQNFLTGSRLAAPATTDGAADGTPFAGTFRFEQQCLRHPAAGTNVVVLGDAAGMGHHALSSGLEMGASDLEPLRELAQDVVRPGDRAGAIARYASRVYRSRMTLLALGMHEYYPQLEADPIELLHRAADLVTPGDAIGARIAFEALLSDALGGSHRATAEADETVAA